MNITVYCASSFGHDSSFEKAARELGAWIAAQGHTLVYGGTHVGLMGLIADTVLDGGGYAIGVLPDVLVEKEPPYSRLPKLYRVKTMAERRTKMIELGDVFVALPGGPGTLEELSEIMSLAKVGTPAGQLFLLNLDGYYDDLTNLYARMYDHEFMTDEVYAQMASHPSVQELTASLALFDNKEKGE